MRRAVLRRTLVEGRRVEVWVALFNGVRVGYAPTQKVCEELLDWWESLVKDEES